MNHKQDPPIGNPVPFVATTSSTYNFLIFFVAEPMSCVFVMFGSICPASKMLIEADDVFKIIL